MAALGDPEGSDPEGLFAEPAYSTAMEGFSRAGMVGLMLPAPNGSGQGGKLSVVVPQPGPAKPSILEIRLG